MDSNALLENEIRRTNPKIIVDVGSGSAEYLLSSAELMSNLNRRYIAIEPKYQDKNRVPERRDNIECVIGDARYLPIKDNASDLTTDFGCSPFVLKMYSDGKRIFEEMQRITKQKGSGVIGCASDNVCLFPSDEVKQARLKELTNEAVRVGYEDDIIGMRLIMPPTKNFQKHTQKSENF